MRKGRHLHVFLLVSTPYDATQAGFGWSVEHKPKCTVRSCKGKCRGGRVGRDRAAGRKAGAAPDGRRGKGGLPREEGEAKGEKETEETDARPNKRLREKERAESRVLVTLFVCL